MFLTFLANSLCWLTFSICHVSLPIFLIQLFIQIESYFKSISIFFKSYFFPFNFWIIISQLKFFFFLSLSRNSWRAMTCGDVRWRAMTCGLTQHPQSLLAPLVARCQGRMVDGAGDQGAVVVAVHLQSQLAADVVGGVVLNRLHHVWFTWGWRRTERTETSQWRGRGLNLNQKTAETQRQISCGGE